MTGLTKSSYWVCLLQTLTIKHLKAGVTFPYSDYYAQGLLFYSFLLARIELDSAYSFAGKASYLLCALATGWLLRLPKKKEEVMKYARAKARGNPAVGGEGTPLSSKQAPPQAHGKRCFSFTTLVDVDNYYRFSAL